MISNRLITEEYMNKTSDFNETTTLTYSLPTKKNILVDISMQKPCWQCFHKKNKNWKNWIRKYKRKYGKLNYLKMLDNTNGGYQALSCIYRTIKSFSSLEHDTILIRRKN